MRERRRTSTSNFGAGARESHDATAFYDRFRPPELSDDEDVRPPKPVATPFVCGDGRSMDAVDDGSVALVVTSLTRTDAIWRSLGRASALHGLVPATPIVLLTTAQPKRSSESDTVLRAAGPERFFDAIDLLSDEARVAWRPTPTGPPAHARFPASGQQRISPADHGLTAAR